MLHIDTLPGWIFSGGSLVLKMPKNLMGSHTSVGDQGPDESECLEKVHLVVEWVGVAALP